MTTGKYKFKVGDRVRRINTINVGIAPGQEGYINNVLDRDFVSVTWDNLQDNPVSNDVMHDVQHLELVTKSKAETKPSNPKDRAATHRLDLSLFPETAVVFGAVAMTEGDCKYGGYNYRVAGVKVSTYIAAQRRHVGKYFDRGEWADPKTKVPHLANAIACLAVLIDGHCKGNITDDRPPKMEADLYTWAEQAVENLHKIFPDGIERFTETKDGNTDGSLPDWLTQKP